MSNQPQGLRTPHRFNMFDDDEQTNNVFTPCTRLSKMTIESQANGNSRFRKAQFQLSATNFADKLMGVVREEEGSSSSTHPNLDMFLGSDKISMFDKSKDQLFSFSEDEDSDEGDLFSSTLCPMSSPERPLTRQSIFDDETMNSPPPEMNILNRKSIFDDDDDDDEDEEENEQDEEDYYDPSNSWLSQIYTDTNELIDVNVQQEDEDADEEENRPPRFWSDRSKESKMRRTLPLEEDNSAHERLPLREIRFEDYLSDDGLPAKKKSLLSNGKPQKMRYMRTLSPPRYAKRKGKEPAENIMPLSSAIL